MNHCSCGARASKFSVLSEYKKIALLNERSLLKKLLAKRNDKRMLYFCGRSLGDHSRRFLEYDESALCTSATCHGTFVFAQKFLLQLGGFGRA